MTMWGANIFQICRHKRSGSREERAAVGVSAQPEPPAILLFFFFFLFLAIPLPPPLTPARLSFIPLVSHSAAQHRSTSGAEMRDPGLSLHRRLRPPWLIFFRRHPASVQSARRPARTNSTLTCAGLTAPISVLIGQPLCLRWGYLTWKVAPRG